MEMNPRKILFTINGYDIVAVIPSMFTRTDNQPDCWYLVGIDRRGDAVTATTYDLSDREHWSSGDYFMATPGHPGRALETALRHAFYKAGADLGKVGER